jgi:hypothetical protein
MGKGQSKSYDISKYTIIQFLQLGSASLFFFNDVRFVSDIGKKKAICPNITISCGIDITCKRERKHIN